MCYKKEFQDTIKLALNTYDPESKNIITFGITPSYAETGYGYIKYCDDTIQEFIEKPNLITAQKLIENPMYLWNSGIFIFNIVSILEEFKKYEIDMYNLCMDCYSKSIKRDNVIKIDNSFSLCKNISFDYAIMEKTTNGKIVKYNGVWTDIGDWDRLINFMDTNNIDNNNNNNSNFICYESNNCYVKSDKGIITIVNVDDIVVIKDGDNILISKKGKSSNIKYVMDNIVIKKD